MRVPLGNAAWAFAARVADSFSYGWPAAIRGMEGGGRVEGLPLYSCVTDEGDIAPKCPTEVAITDRREFELSRLGFLPLCHYKSTDFAVFLSSSSCQSPRHHVELEDTAKAEIASKVEVTLCLSRSRTTSWPSAARSSVRS